MFQFLVLFVFLNSASAVCNVTLTVEKDNKHQAQIYSENTLLMTAVHDENLYGYYMNSVLQVQTVEFLIATGICEPYVAFRFNQMLHVLAKGCNSSQLFLTMSGDRQEVNGRAQLIRFEFVTGIVYMLQNDGRIHLYSLPGWAQKDIISLGYGITDFYVSGEWIYFLRSGKLYRWHRKNRTSHFLKTTERIETFAVPTSCKSVNSTNGGGVFSLFLVLFLLCVCLILAMTRTNKFY